MRFVFVLLLASCGAPPEGGASYSCDYAYSGVRQCDEYDSLPEAPAAFSMDCNKIEGTVSSTCSRTDSVGSCQYLSGSISIKSFYYANAAAQMRACIENGSNYRWVDP